MILFPETWEKGANPNTKYNRASLWLCSFAQVVHPNIRDIFSASGKVTIVDGIYLPENSRYPHIVKTIVDSAPTIKNILTYPTKETYELIEEFHPELLRGRDLYHTWLDLCLKNCNSEGAPLDKWIEKQPNLVCKK